MKYSIIIAATLFVAAQSTFTNTSCDTTADCESDEWCYKVLDECVPNCNVEGGVNCTTEINPDYECDDVTGECGIKCDTEDGVNCNDYYDAYDYVCSNDTGFCVEVPCGERAYPTNYCLAQISAEFGGIDIFAECEEDYCEVPKCNYTEQCPEEYYCNPFIGGYCLKYCSDTSECPDSFLCTSNAQNGTCITAAPTEMPTAEPTTEPTAEPTAEPTTTEPSTMPTEGPSTMPTSIPTDEPEENESGVQGYGVMMILGVIAFMISYVT